MQQLGLNSPERPKQESRWMSFLWPSMGYLPDVESALDIGRLACFAIAILSGVSMLATRSAAHILDIIFFVALGWGIGRRSRVCATVALGLFVLSLVFAFASQAIGCGGLVIKLALLVALFHATRASFVYRSLIKITPPEASNSGSTDSGNR